MVPLLAGSVADRPPGPAARPGPRQPARHDPWPGVGWDLLCLGRRKLRQYSLYIYNFGSCPIVALDSKLRLWRYSAMRITHFALAQFIFLTASAPVFAEAMTDDAIRRILIRESIARYSGNCPCPDTLASNGSRCGERSAWSREGGDAPLCYPKDVSSADVAAYRAKNDEAGTQEVRGRGRSSGGGARSHSSGSSLSSGDWTPSYAGRKKSTRPEPTYDSSPAELDELEDFSEPPAPTRSQEMSQPKVEVGAPPPARLPKLKEAKVAPETVPSAPTHQRTTQPAAQQLPDCPPGTSLARWNGQNICVGTPETLANVTRPGVPDSPSGAGASFGEMHQQSNFADVLSGLQTRGSASVQPIQLPTAAPRGQALSAPATGLLNCGDGTRVTYVDGRIECR
jgi:hypothetical protein